MPSKSKAKGASFERDVAKFLSELYGDSFTRTPHSGAFTGGQNAHRKTVMTEGQIRSFKGDIIPPDHWKKFNCECKNYGSFPFHHLLFDKKIPMLDDWIEQTMDAADTGDCNIVFFKITRIGKFVVYEADQPFRADRFIEYCDKNQKVWRITEFESFFDRNKDAFAQANIG